MSKLLFFSDIHIHAHKNSLQRLQDCIDVLKWTLSTARDRKIKNVVFLGDLFHDRQRIQVIAYQKVFDVFCDFPDVNVYLLLGNHDLWFYDKLDISSVKPLSGLPNITTIQRPCTMSIDGFDIDFVPFTHDPISSMIFTKKSRIMCGHLAVDGATLNKLYKTKAEVSIESEKDVIKVTTEVFSGWEKVFLGHYHCSQKLDQIEYVGSPLELSFGEAFQEKHIIVFDTDTLECEYIVNDFSPKHLIIKPEEVNNTCLDNNFIQIKVDNIESLDIVDMRKNIKENAKVQSLEFKETKKKEVSVDREVIQEKFDITNGDILERYIAAIGSDLDKVKLLQIGKDICCEN